MHILNYSCILALDKENRYMKKSGELREAFGTTSKALVERYINSNGISREHYATTAYFDVEKASWRSFRWENIVAVL